MSIRLRLFLTGVLLVIPVIVAGAQGDINFYERVREKYLQEQRIEGSEEEVREFIAREIGKIPTAEPNGSQALTADDVKLVLEGKKSEFCSKLKQSFGSCEDNVNQIQSLASDLARIRGLGRDLLLTTTGYEAGVDGSFGGLLNFPSQFAGITRIWQTSGDHLLSPSEELRIRVAPLPDGMDQKFSQAGQALSDLEDDMTPAVWRYRYGLRALKRTGQCDKKGAAELYRITTRRWCDVEEALQKIGDALPANPQEYDPILQPDEIVFFPPRPLEGADHVLVWMYARNVYTKVTVDVGLSWDLPTEPALPALLPEEGGESNCMSEIHNSEYCDIVQEKKILPGGLHPSPPVEPIRWEGLCAMPFGRQGYLCRPMEQPFCGPQNQGSSGSRSSGSGTILLTECKLGTLKLPIDVSNTGPDYCRIGGWKTPTSTQFASIRDTPNIDPELRPLSGAPCAVDFYFRDNCFQGQPGTAATYPKDQNGVIKICLPTQYEPELALHEIIHAQQICSLNLPPGTPFHSTVEECCAKEYPAYTAQANILAEAGVLSLSNMTLDEYVGGGMNGSCQNYGRNACSSVDVDDWNRKSKIMWDEVKRLRSEPPPKCSEIVEDLNNMEPRAASMLETMLKKALTPGVRSKYENTIGNNLCYLGQSVEETIEESRFIPGRMTEGVQDESFPWDSCAAPDPRNGEMLPMPVISPVAIPPYNPRLLLQTLDTMLCQLNGLPALTPPVLCGFNPTRRLNAPMETDILGFIMGLGNQQGETLTALSSAEGIGTGVANRLGTSITLDYLDRALRSLTELMTGANTLIKQIEKTRFPLTACPRNAAMGNICGQFQ